jgi:multidrug efflux pump subunit AcrA (membrane-fusion protein)
MKRLTRKRAVMTGIALVVVAAIVYAFLPDPVPVQTATVTRGPLQVIIEEEGETRLEDRYLITAPVAAFAQRIELEVGDPVRPGQAVVRLEPPRSPILDPRAQSEAAARVAAARAQLGQAEIVATRAVEERARVERLVAARAASLAASARSLPLRRPPCGRRPVLSLWEHEPRSRRPRPDACWRSTAGARAPLHRGSRSWRWATPSG